MSEQIQSGTIREEFGQKYTFKRYEFSPSSTVEMWESLNEDGGIKVALTEIQNPFPAWRIHYRDRHMDIRDQYDQMGRSEDSKAESEAFRIAGILINQR